jgi:hypothetical protein
LTGRYRQAVESFQVANEYFEKLSATIDQKDIEKWLSEISNAESNRLETPEAMDVMGTRQVTAAGKSNPNLHSHEETSPGEEWITLALTIEERQYVLASILILRKIWLLKPAFV